MKRGVSVALPIFGAISLVALFAFLLDGLHIDVLQPAGEVASTQRDIFVFTILLSAVVVIPVFTLLAVFSIKYRASNKKAKYTPEWGENKWLEGLWWGIPLLIIGILGVVIYQTSHSLDPSRQLSGEKQLDVQVVALRWKWLFIYPEQGVVTLNYLPLPLDRPVRFSITANAPMSAFWIPALGSQVYTMNGMESRLNLRATELGDFTGYTTNINGKGYAKMTFQARVMTPDKFDAWANTASDSPDSMTMRVYETLAEPKSDTTEKTYRLANAKLFEMIVDKHGHGHGNKEGKY